MVTVRNQIPFTAEILTSTTERRNESRGREDGGGAQSSILGEVVYKFVRANGD